MFFKIAKQVKVSVPFCMFLYPLICPARKHKVMDPRLFITDPAILSAGFPHSSGNCIEIQKAVHVWGLVPQGRDFRTEF